MTSNTRGRIAGAVMAAALIVGNPSKPAAAPKRLQQEKAKLEAEIIKQEEKIGNDIWWLFRYQVEAGWYRNRLLSLQGQWKELMTRFGVAQGAATAGPTYPPPPSRGFRIDAVVGSEELDFAGAVGKPGCSQMRGCRLWLRISFSTPYVTRNASFEVSADLRAVDGQSYAVPTKELKVRQAVMIVDVALDRIYLPDGKNSGSVRVFGDKRVERKSFTLTVKGGASRKARGKSNELSQ